MKTRLAVALLSAAVAVQAAYSLEAAATVVNFDEIAVVKNGTTILDDSFDRNITLAGGNGKVVDSGTTFTDGTPASYFVQGSIPITTANNGQAQFNTANGALIGQVRDVNLGLLTGTDPAGPHTLTPANAFSVTGLFDVALPSVVSGRYQLLIGNNQGPGNPGLILHVRIFETDTGPVLQFQWVDNIHGQNTIIDQVALTPAELAEPQLELEISHDVANSDVLTALYAFGSGNTLASFNGNLTELGRTDSSTDIFTSTKNFAQPGFEAFDPVPEPSSLAILAAAALCSLGVIRRYAKWRLCSGAAHAIGSKLTPRRRAAPAKSLSFVASGIPLRMASSR